MYYEGECDSQIAARMRAAAFVFSFADPLHPCISLFTHRLLAQRRFSASEGSPCTSAPRILIVTPELEFPATATKQTLPPISNRYKKRFSRPESICRNRFGVLPSNFHLLASSLQDLIANLELEFRLTSIRISEQNFPIANFSRFLVCNRRESGQFRTSFQLRGTNEVYTSGRAASVMSEVAVPRAAGPRLTGSQLHVTVCYGLATQRFGNCFSRLLIFGISQIWMYGFSG